MCPQLEIDHQCGNMNLLWFFCDLPELLYLDLVGMVLDAVHDHSGECKFAIPQLHRYCILSSYFEGEIAVIDLSPILLIKA